MDSDSDWDVPQVNVVQVLENQLHETKNELYRVNGENAVLKKNLDSIKDKHSQQLSDLMSSQTTSKSYYGQETERLKAEIRALQSEKAFLHSELVSPRTFKVQTPSSSHLPFDSGFETPPPKKQKSLAVNEVQSSAESLYSTLIDHRMPGSTVPSLQVLEGLIYDETTNLSLASHLLESDSLGEFSSLAISVLQRAQSLKASWHLLALVYALSMRAQHRLDAPFARNIETLVMQWHQELVPLPTIDPQATEAFLPRKSVLLLSCVLGALDLLSVLDGYVPSPDFLETLQISKIPTVVLRAVVLLEGRLSLPIGQPLLGYLTPLKIDVEQSPTELLVSGFIQHKQKTAQIELLEYSNKVLRVETPSRVPQLLQQRWAMTLLEIQTVLVRSVTSLPPSKELWLCVIELLAANIDAEPDTQGFKLVKHCVYYLWLNCEEVLSKTSYDELVVCLAKLSFSETHGAQVVQWAKELLNRSLDPTEEDQIVQAFGVVFDS